MLHCLIFVWMLILFQLKTALTDIIFVADLNKGNVCTSQLSESGPILWSELDVNMTMLKPVAVDFEPNQGFIFWTDVSLNSIHRVRYDGSNYETLITDAQVPDGLAVHSTLQRLFWTDSGNDRIEVAYLNGTDRSTIVNDGLSKPRAIVVDSFHGLLFWTDWGSDAKIERSDLDGLNRLVIVGTDLVWPNGIAVDPKENKLYWCDASLQKIESSDLFGNFRQTLVYGSVVGHPFDVAVHGQYLYWTDWRSENLKRINRFDGTNQVEQVGSAVFDRAGGLHIYEMDECASSPCQNTATCVDYIEMFVCECRNGFQGKLCDIALPTTIQSSSICKPPKMNDNLMTLEHSKDEYSPGEEVWFVCDSTKLLIGSASVTCQSNGDWSDSLPSCIHTGEK